MLSFIDLSLNIQGRNAGGDDVVTCNIFLYCFNKQIAVVVSFIMLFKARFVLEK